MSSWQPTPKKAAGGWFGEGGKLYCFLFFFFFLVSIRRIITGHSSMFFRQARHTATQPIRIRKSTHLTYRIQILVKGFFFGGGCVVGGETWLFSRPEISFRTTPHLFCFPLLIFFFFFFFSPEHSQAPALTRKSQYSPQRLMGLVFILFFKFPFAEMPRLDGRVFSLV
jgi:hypothetical protein